MYKKEYDRSSEIDMPQHWTVFKELKEDGEITLDRVAVCETEGTADLLIAAELVREIYEQVFADTGTFEEEFIGADLAYLLGAMLIDVKCEWPEDRPIVKLLREAYPDSKHPVWSFIEIE